MSLSQIKVRRKPQQSRARLTQEALIESFVQLLKEKDSTEITIREITDIAGVGLGTFYEYFSKKEDLIALTIHQYIKNNANTIKQQATLWMMDVSQTPINRESLQNLIEYLLQAQISDIQSEQKIWAQLFLLERQISSPKAYQKHYALMIQSWNQALSAFTQSTESNLSLNIHRISYGFISQTLLVNSDFQNWKNLYQDMLEMIQFFILKTQKI
ncbi:TetR/AcrR family transcriptional regulator [Acinetobacter sp. ANC 4648]|uniref:TetR/AcrR family transcriptional regulator n=1 Tax=Acinetobacter sp. ANC 4648 TaxID=1977875 RepID=UPI000A359D7B|nr:TetR/AcrR family transcriptional regulator [Acinetobacter sp. ANC 4648]OTG80639.1 TetR family transcriptional regulator [Acinetobacter sp. ANC 4648]